MVNLNNETITSATVVELNRTQNALSSTENVADGVLKPSLILNSNQEIKGSMTSIVHPFFYIIFGGVIFIAVSVVATIFTVKFLKRKSSEMDFLIKKILY